MSGQQMIVAYVRVCGGRSVLVCDVWGEARVQSQWGLGRVFAVPLLCPLTYFTTIFNERLEELPAVNVERYGGYILTHTAFRTKCPLVRARSDKHVWHGTPLVCHHPTYCNAAVIDARPFTLCMTFDLS